MSRKIMITADSTCDLSPELVSKYNITIIPLYIHLGNKVCRDGIDVTPDDVYAHVAKTKTLPKTAAVNPADYVDVFKSIRQKEDCDIIHINISSGFSSSYQNACIAAEGFDGVFPVDSKNLSTGSGHLVIEAAVMAQNGMCAPDIVKQLESLRERVDASFVIDTLDYLHKGGRCSAVAALGANLLKLKPCIEVKDGKMGVGKKYRGKLESVLIEYTKNRLADTNLKRDRIFITHSGCDKALEDAVRREVESYGLFDEVIVTHAGCTVCSHCGYNTLGVLFIRN